MKINVRYIALTLVMLVQINSSIGQDWTWSRQLPGAGPSVITSLEADDQMDLYIAGQFKTSIDLGEGVLAVEGNTDLFLARYDSSGAFIDKIHAYSAGNKVRPKNVVVDHNGDILLTGFYDGPVTGDLIFSDPGASANTFVAKLSGVDMSVMWSDIISGTADVKAQYVAVDPSGNVYVTGFSTSTINVGDTVFNDTLGGDHNFIAKYATNGDFEWAAHVPTTANDGKFIKITAPNDNEIFVAGYFTDTLFADNHKVWTPNETTTDGVFLKLNGDGEALELRTLSGSGHDRYNGIDTDEVGNIYLTGYFTGTATLDNLAAGDKGSLPLVSEGGFDIVVAKYNPSARLLWHKRNGSGGEDIGYGANVSENLIQFAGKFTDSIMFNLDTLRTLDPADADAAFFVYDTDGNPLTGASVQGIGDDKSELMNYDEAGNAYMGVTYQAATLTFGDSVYTNPAGAGKNNPAFGKYKFDFISTWSHQKNVSCNGGDDGELTITSYFGTGPYTYAWSSPDGNVDGLDAAVATGLTAGTYTVTITDANLKQTTSIPITLTEPDAIVIATDSTNPLCYQSADGTITITDSTGGVGPYSFVWSGPSGDSPTEPNQTGLSAGVYNLTVSDQNSCLVYETVELIEPEPIYFGNVVTVQEDPAGSKTGSIALDVRGGTPAYTYAWVDNSISDSLIGRTQDTLLNLAEGDYKAYVTDANSCQSDTLITVPGESLRVNLVGTDALCYGANNGSAYATITSGRKADPITFSFKDEIGTTIIPVNDSIIQSLSPGKYYVTAQEQSGLNRVAIDSVTISEPDTIIVSIKSDSAMCFNAVDGAVTLTVTGGTIPYNYNWSSGDDTKNILNVAAGIYSVTVTDDNACAVMVVDTVFQPDSIEISFNVVEEIACFGLNSGVLEALVTGGTEVYSYEWDDSRSQTTQVANSLSANTYEVLVTDANSCTNTDTFTIEQPEQLVVALVDSTDLSCYNAADGRIAVTITGGTGSYSYAWNNGLADTNIVEDLLASTYTLTASDANACATDELIVIIESPQTALVLTEDVSAHEDILCFGDGDGSVTVISSGGWTGTNTFSLDKVDWQLDSTFAGLAGQTYTAYVKDSNGCVDSTGVEITEPDELILTVVDSTDISCRGAADGRITVALSGGVLPYTYDWSNELPNTNIVENLSPSTYTLTSSDANACETELLTVIIEEPETALTLIEDVAAHKDNLCFGDADGSITVVSSGGWSGAKTYSLNKADWQSDNTFASLAAQSYNTYVKDANDCIDSVSAAITEPTEIVITGEQAIGNSIIVLATGGTEPLYYVLNGTEDPQTSGRFENLDNDTYFVNVTDANDCGPVRSQDLVVDITSLSESLQDITTIYPNPSSGLFNLTFIAPSGGDFILEVYSVSGNRVYETSFYANASENKHVEVDLSSVSSGVYLVKLNGVVLNSKLVVE